MKLIIVILVSLGIVVSILSYLDIGILAGPIAALFGGEIWEIVKDFFAVFGGFFTRLFQNQYILLIIANFIIFYMLRALVDFLRARKSAKRNNDKKTTGESE